MAFLNHFLAEIIPKIKDADLPKLKLGIDHLLVWMNGGVGNFALTMIIFTILLKLVLFPLDYLSKKTMKRNAMISEKLKPQLEKLEKQCHGDKKLFQQQSFVLQRKYGYRISGMCLPTLLTLGIFIFVFSAIGNYSSFTNAKIYNEMVDTYNITYVEDGANYELPLTEKEKLMVETYKKHNPSFLWIKNTLRPDGYNGAIPSYSDITSNNTIGVQGLKIPDKELDGGIGTLGKKHYDLVMGAVKEDYDSKGFTLFGTRLNGWFLLPFLAAAASFFSQWFTQKTQPQATGQNNTTMKVMMVVFPAIMFFFALRYTSAFSLYIITNSLLTALATYLVNKIVQKKYADNVFELTETKKPNQKGGGKRNPPPEKPSYSR